MSISNVNLTAPMDGKGFGLDSAVGDLYTRAKQQGWNVDTDIEWNEPVRDRSPLTEEALALKGFAPFESLTAKERVALLWRRHVLHISDILCGEQGALLLSAQLLSCMPDLDSRLFASSQVSDEARHVEFFSRYLAEIGGVAPPGDGLRRLICHALEDGCWEIKMITCQIVIETLALSQFRQLQQQTRVPLLRSALGLILRDEARHVNFGLQILRAHLRTLGDEALDRLGGYALGNIMALSDMEVDMRLADEMGWDKAALRFHLRVWKLRHPEADRSRFRLLARNLEGVGLLRGRTRVRLESLCR